MQRRFFSNEVLKTVVTQLTFVIFLTFVVVLCTTGQNGASFLLGGLICVIANVYFYIRVFSYFGARAARQIVNAFYRGEAIKIALSAMGFYLAFNVPAVSALWLFIGYAAAQIGFRLAPLMWGSTFLTLRNQAR